MSFNALSFLAEPGFVVPWYLFGALAAAWVIWDLRRVNTPLKTAIQWAWPIVVLFFSVLGLALYFATARAPGVARARGAEEKKRLHDAYEQSMLRRVNGAVIHCIAGDGLGIMTAMVIARVLEMSFWQEFWFEYAVGFAFGWFIFQLKSMKMMTDSTARALAMAFRAEFFSMLTVMGGMGAVMTWVTPAVVGMQPKPTTAAFWGFGMLGLLVGYVFTFPVNWLMVKVGWKHGMGSAEGVQPVQQPRRKAALVATFAALGLAAMALPAWLTVLREQRGMDVVAWVILQPRPGAGEAAQRQAVVDHGLAVSMQLAQAQLQSGLRERATAALDDALRASEVLRVAWAGPQAEAWSDAVRQARRALQNGHAEEAARVLAQATHGSMAPDGQGAETAQRAAAALEPSAYRGVALLNALGAVIGEVRAVEGQRVRVALGGAHDVWGWWDGRPRQEAWIPASGLLLGTRRHVGKSFAMLPTADTPPLALTTPDAAGSAR
ncbi:DUF4396 domain-containing protein [Azohydromonas australica]|uniref:DUF4396 domain-containing protein n=1 Tax=Azohydromonas australica TaxID=364039 RepID=UPI00041B1F2B|nr:DUF4396 domain-containing protein [Azohydromonas australica]